MKKRTILYLLLLIGLRLNAQVKYDYQWMFNAYVLVDFRNDTLNISRTPPTPYLGSGDYCTSICDKAGNLLFYTGGCFVLNKTGGYMQGGENINSYWAFNGWCADNDLPMRQNNTIVPYPGDSMKYVIFNLDFDLPISGLLPMPTHLLYHVVDMSQDNGLGAITSLKQVAIEDTLARECLQAVRHANGGDWWIVSPKWSTNCYFITPLTAQGIGVPQRQCMGATWGNIDRGGQATFSPDAKKYVRVNRSNTLMLFDFDNATGTLANPQQINLNTIDSVERSRGVCFSPNSRYLYVSAWWQMYQYDLWADDIQNSRQLVCEIDPVSVQNNDGYSLFQLMKLGPDGRIYIAGIGSHDYLSVIEHPNCPGINCLVKPNSIALPFNNYSGISNLPHFNIIESNYDCSAVSSQEQPIEKEFFDVLPNPVDDYLTINAPQVQTYIYELWDLNSKLLLSATSAQPSTSISLSHLPSGVYVLKCRYNNRCCAKKIVKM